jgi:hypothetical protein
MDPGSTLIPFSELVRVADGMFAECGDDEAALAQRLETLPEPIRDELLVSDLLNAWQAFFYFFRTWPVEIVRERLELEPASVLVPGVFLGEVELLDLVFGITDRRPVVTVSDGDTVLAIFSGPTAYRDALSFIKSTL